MGMRKSYQFRIYPTKNQEVKLNQTLSVCRHLYNDALAERRDQAELNRLKRDFQVFPWGKPDWIRYEDQQNALPKTKLTLQKDVHSQVLQNALKRLDRSFKNFFNGYGYPRFQGRNRYNSFTYPQAGFSIYSGKLKLSKIGSIQIIQHREIEGKIKTCTIKKDIDQWYASFSCELDDPVQEHDIGTRIGVDVGLVSLITLSNGDKIEPPEFLRSSESKLIKEQKRLSRKAKGSSNRNKQRITVAKTHRRIRNQRKDFAHKLSKSLVDSYDCIVFEDLKVKNMVQNRLLAKTICDAGWDQLMRYTEFKAACAGKTVKFIDARNTSQNCSRCGQKVHKSLAIRTHRCPYCGLIMDRDHNAAINILMKSRKCTVGTTGINACQGYSRGISMQQDAQGFCP